MIVREGGKYSILAGHVTISKYNQGPVTGKRRMNLCYGGNLWLNDQIQDSHIHNVKTKTCLLEE